MGRQHGFTLTETLAALAVAGIGLALAVPGLAALARGNGEASTVNQLVATLHAARSAAITRNAPVAVCASADGAHCDGAAWADGWIAFVDPDGDQDRGPAEDILEQAPPLGAFSVHSEQYPLALGFGPDGRVAGTTTGEFAICAPAAELAGKVVVLRASGLPALAGAGRDGAPRHCPSA